MSNAISDPSKPPFDKPPRRGWSRQGAEAFGVPYPDYEPGESCYFCGVPGCEECGPPPKLLAQSGLIPEPDDKPDRTPTRRVHNRQVDMPTNGPDE